MAALAKLFCNFCAQDAQKMDRTADFPPCSIGYAKYNLHLAQEVTTFEDYYRTPALYMRLEQQSLRTPIIGWQCFLLNESGNYCAYSCQPVFPFAGKTGTRFLGGYFRMI